MVVGAGWKKGWGVWGEGGRASVINRVSMEGLTEKDTSAKTGMR